MRVSHTAVYDAPLADVHAMLTDHAFREHAAQQTGVVSAEVTVEETAEGQVVTVDQVQPTAGVPAFARKFAGETTRAVQVERWSSPDRAAFSVTTPGRPTDIRGTLTLSESGGRTTKTFDGELKVKVPLIAGKLEALMADLFDQGMDTEHEAGVAWLSRHG
jgi:hypothetical protein